MCAACGCSWEANEKGLLLMMSGYAPRFSQRAQKDGKGNGSLTGQGVLMVLPHLNPYCSFGRRTWIF